MLSRNVAELSEAGTARLQGPIARWLVLIRKMQRSIVALQSTVWLPPLVYGILGMQANQTTRDNLS